MIKHDDWEHIGDPNLFRLNVRGGWLIRMDYDVTHNFEANGMGMVNGYDFRPTLTFMPDPNHEWDIEEKTDANLSPMV